LLLIALVVSALRLPVPGETGPMARVHSIARAPLGALALLPWLTIPVSGILVGSLYLREGHRFQFRELVEQIAELPNLGIQTLGIGLSGRYGISDGAQQQGLRVKGLAHALHWLMWFSIPAAILVVALIAV